MSQEVRFLQSFNNQNVTAWRQEPKTGHTMGAMDKSRGWVGAGPVRSQVSGEWRAILPLVVDRKRLYSGCALIAPQWIRQTIP